MCTHTHTHILCIKSVWVYHVPGIYFWSDLHMNAFLYRFWATCGSCPRSVNFIDARRLLMWNFLLSFQVRFCPQELNLFSSILLKSGLKCGHSVRNPSAEPPSERHISLFTASDYPAEHPRTEDIQACLSFIYTYIYIGVGARLHRLFAGSVDLLVKTCHTSPPSTTHPSWRSQFQVTTSSTRN